MLFEELIALLMHSPLHKSWRLDEIVRLFVPPLILGQYMVWRTDGQPVAFISWAFLTPEAADGLLHKTRKLQPEDWKAGTEPWIVDLVAPFGHVRNARDQMEEYFSSLGYTEVYAARDTPEGRRRATFGRKRNVA